MSGPGVIVVTGAGSGIGQATAQYLVDRGWLVAGIDMGWRDGGSQSVSRFTVDVTDQGSVSEVVAEIETTLGPIHGAVTCAGVIAIAPVLDLDIDDFRRVMEVNVTGTFLVARECARSMVLAGHPGSIVTISSVSGLLAAPHRAAYSASKGAVGALTRAMAFDLAASGVRVNSIAPGSVNTPLQSVAQPAHVRDAIARAIPLGHSGDPLEIARVAGFLLSDDSSFVTGQTWFVDGGQSIQAGWRTDSGAAQ